MLLLNMATTWKSSIESRLCNTFVYLRPTTASQSLPFFSLEVGRIRLSTFPRSFLYYSPFTNADDYSDLQNNALNKIIKSVSNNAYHLFRKEELQDDKPRAQSNKKGRTTLSIDYSAND